MSLTEKLEVCIDNMIFHNVNVHRVLMLPIGTTVSKQTCLQERSHGNQQICGQKQATNWSPGKDFEGLHAVCSLGFPALGNRLVQV